MSLARELGAKSVGLTTKLTSSLGKVPTSKAPKFPMCPNTDYNKCTTCGACARECPLSAIKMPDVKTEKKLCVGCARCLAICPKNARQFTGGLFKFSEWAVMKIYGSHKESELYF